MMAAAGLVGGVLGYVLQTTQNPDDVSVDTNYNHSSGVWFMLIILGIGAGITAGNALFDRRIPSTQSILIALGSLLVGGYVSGYLAQSVYESMLDLDAIASCLDVQCQISEVRPARTIGWMIAGALGGVGVGLSFLSPKRVQNGAIGGAIGGAVGGFMFDSIASQGDDANSSRLIAIVLIGTLMGALIGAIDVARTTMWIDVLTGEMRGRQFGLIDTRSTVGSARSATVQIVADRAVKEIHLTLHRTGSSQARFECSTGCTAEVGGLAVASGSLSPGDVVTVGSTQLRLGFRRATVATSGSPSVSPTLRTIASSQGGQTVGGARITATEANAESDRRAGQLPVSPPGTTAGSALPPPQRSRPRLPTAPVQPKDR